MNCQRNNDQQTLGFTTTIQLKKIKSNDFVLVSNIYKKQKKNYGNPLQLLSYLIFPCDQPIYTMRFNHQSWTFYLSLKMKKKKKKVPMQTVANRISAIFTMNSFWTNFFLLFGSPFFSRYYKHARYIKCFTRVQYFQCSNTIETECITE